MGRDYKKRKIFMNDGLPRWWCVKVIVPKGFLRRTESSKHPYLTKKDKARGHRYLKRIEEAENKIRHLRSRLEAIKNRML